MDAIVISVVVVLNAVLGWVQETKAHKAVVALTRMTQASSGVVRGGQLLRIPGAGLVCGDVLVLAEGDAVSANARLAEDTGLRLLEVSLTGGSERVLKDAATLEAQGALGDRLNMIFKGGGAGQRARRSHRGGSANRSGRRCSDARSDRRLPTPGPAPARAVHWCFPCWSRRSSGSTSSPMPARCWRWASTRSPKT
jgi:hypothetical protein